MRKFFRDVFGKVLASAIWDAVKTHFVGVIVTAAIASAVAWLRSASWLILIPLLILLGVAINWISWKLFTRSSATYKPDTVLVPPAAPAVKFGHPRERAGEPYVSIWHVPIELIGDEACEPKCYNRCTAKLIFRHRIIYLPPELALRSEQRGVKGGLPEFPLAVGDDPRWIPIAIRSEKNWDQLSQFEARFMDEAFFEQSPNPARLMPGEYEFIIHIKSGLRTWESQSYWLTVPARGVNNGKFILRE